MHESSCSRQQPALATSAAATAAEISYEVTLAIHIDGLPQPTRLSQAETSPCLQAEANDEVAKCQTSADGPHTSSTVNLSTLVDHQEPQGVNSRLLTWTDYWESWITLSKDFISPEPNCWTKMPKCPDQHYLNVFDERHTWKTYKKSATGMTNPSYPRRPLPPYDAYPNRVEKMLEAYGRPLEDNSWRWDSRNRVWLDEEGRVLLSGPGPR
ncbi:uncharacterized protein TRIREDRAFT_104289 [Trichoderma reesei QM6a]|uniref:Predicted protein n=2 Tax=Hypocrea jecorina TaxID=51453 RepID=G0RBZ5_HYPJQ|nr:uncharacterized protein TRIREDRAFT_104289 [Trichoderma reesei QM6a]EGR51415.1 predicted protein [Trichoderma reesei QM6a]ETS04641.1 hypothetical protein M419DRAFT_127757 [Trichoderma reesei RUT C-30]